MLCTLPTGYRIITLATRPRQTIGAFALAAIMSTRRFEKMFVLGMLIRFAALYYMIKFIIFLFRAMADHGY